MPRGLGAASRQHAGSTGVVAVGNRAGGRSGSYDPDDGMTPLVWESAMVPLYEEYIDVCCSMYFDGGSSQGVTVDGLRGYFRRLIERERARPAKPAPLEAIPKEAMTKEGGTGIVDGEVRKETLLAEVESCTGGLLTSRLRKRQAIDLWGPLDAALFLAGLSRYGRNWHRIGNLTEGRKDAKDVADMCAGLYWAISRAARNCQVDRSSGESVGMDNHHGRDYGGGTSGGGVKGISLTPQGGGSSEGWGSSSSKRRSPLLGESPSSPMNMSIVVKCRMMMEEMSVELQEMKDSKCELERKVRAMEIECANLREDYQKEFHRRRELQSELQEAEIVKGDLEAQNASLHRKLQLVESRASENEKQCEEVREELKEVTARLSEATTAKSRAEEEIRALKKELCETGDRLVEIEEVRCKDLEDYRGQLMEAERQWREELDAKYEEIAQLTDTLSETTDALEAQRVENEVLTERKGRDDDEYANEARQLQHHIRILEGELKSSSQSARLVAENERDNAVFAREQALEVEASLRKEFNDKLGQQKEKYKRKIHELEEELRKRKEYEARIKELLKTETSLLRRMNDAKALSEDPCVVVTASSPRCHHGHRFRDCCIHRQGVVEVSPRPRSPTCLAVVEECPNASAARYVEEQMRKVERRILLGLKHRRARSSSRGGGRYDSSGRGRLQKECSC
ncbi:hypothetical protein Pmar_PMAR029238 [Perkinsus marinus ATCC 50983]|uniref:Uncharacterized protein n=1 Tax=Perkinsus marinus (strain ATCC 50983 / TXsc) TaxID=423536 RepID=C5KML6_PERM5|nr:hypothetical protein Pmar_PMAR029238 [Perkinsus marinus ATCC 50983]EER14174.1 hypothetical protein Pmar_PMAR029238 [Perkinsus marinus ATCC 50983]|eukprot:XP_002782379.1 hypothetical protein Pmar_PMAR029238 [Perkinsus marinus ATCC 50983]